MFTKQSLKAILEQNIVSISFKKVDGTTRKMKCSLKHDMIPLQGPKKTDRTKPENENILPVWDIENNGIRSFRIDSLIDYKIINED